MEENDDQQVDSTLPPEWTLPELPKVHTPSLSTAEFEEIFGGSDEEDNFPLSMGVLRDHMELDSVLPNPNELFQSTISDTLSLGSKPVDVLADSMETENTITCNNTLNLTVEEANKAAENQNPTSKETNTPYNKNTPSSKKSCEVKRAETGGLECGKEGEEEAEVNKDDDSSPSAPADTASTSRRSARIRAKKERREVVGVTVKEEESELDEESLVDSLLERDKEGTCTVNILSTVHVCL